MTDIVTRLKWVTPNADDEIGHIARVSNPSASMGDPADRLIAYLLRKQHWSPFQMANMCVEVHTTRDISAQILRHQSMAFQEFSTRYAAVEELENYKECRFQDYLNRQSSWTAAELLKIKEVDKFNINGFDIEETVDWWNNIVEHESRRSVEIYQTALRRGVAKEVARCVLPIGLMPTTLYINGTIRSWIHYIALRGEAGTQKEHRVVAQGAYELLREHLPNTAAAFDRWHNTNQIKEKLYTLIMSADDEDTVSLISDAMSDVHDMDTSVNDFAKAALYAIVKEAKKGIEKV